MTDLYQCPHCSHKMTSGELMARSWDECPGCGKGMIFHYKRVPKVVGAIRPADGKYQIFPGFYVETEQKPALWYRFWTRVLLGWKWEPND